MLYDRHMLQTTSITSLKQNIASVLNGVKTTGEPIVVLQRSEPTAVIVDPVYYRILEEALEEEDETGESYKKIIVRKVRSLGTKGDMVAIKEMFQRIDGMPKQGIDLGDDTDLRITIKTKRDE